MQFFRQTSIRSLPKNLRKISARLLLVSFLLASPATAQNFFNRDADALSQEGTLKLFLNQPRQAVDLLNRARQLQRQKGPSAAEFETLASLNLAHVFWLNEPQQALGLAQQQLLLARKLNKPSLTTRALNAIAFIQGRLGNYSEAESALIEAIETIQGSRGPEALFPLNESLSFLGQVYLARGESDKAVAVFSKLLQSEESNHDITNSYRTGDISLSLALRQKGDLSRAESVLRQSVEWRLESGSIDGLVRQAVGSQLEQIRSQFGDLSPKIRQDIERQLREFQERFGEGVVIPETKTPGGDEFGIDTHNVTESVEAGLYVACDRLIEVLIAQSKFEEALVETDRCRSRALVERMAGRVGAVDSGRPIVTANVAPLSIAQLKQVARDRQATIVSYWLNSDSQPFQVSERDKEVFIWSIQPSGAVTFQRNSISAAFEQALRPAGAANELSRNFEMLLLETRSDLGISARGLGVQKISSRSSDKLSRLYRLLIEPVASTLPQNPEALTIVIPHRSLHAVPFAALKDAQGNHVIDKHTVITAPSIQALIYTQRRAQQIRQLQSTGDAIVVGNPTMPPYGEPPRPLDPLPGAQIEAQEVASLLGVPALIGSSATESVVASQLADAPLIHLATHGLLDTLTAPIPQLKLIGLVNFAPDTPAGKIYRSPGLIALTPSQGKDGYLDSIEISRLGLDASLVVLSACNTSRGLSIGEGVIGLQRSFFAAGVPTVIGSLWYVPDAPTAKLMVEFYRNLDRGLSKAQALRQAMLAIKSTDPQPRSWAGFQLAGEPD